MTKLVGQDTGKSITGFAATSPGKSGKNFMLGSNKAASTTSTHSKKETANPVGSSQRFSKTGLGPSSLGDSFRKVAERRKKSRTKTTEPGSRGKTNLNSNVG